MLSARFRKFSDRVVLPLGGAVAKSGISPNVFTLIGLALSAGAAGAFAYENLAYAFILMVLAALFDVLDGAVAKSSGKVTQFGGFLDSVVDRYSDALILIGIALYLKEHYVLVMVAILGSIMVSYTRARAENIIKKCDVGLAERGERLIVLILTTLIAVVTGVKLFYEALLLIAVITHFTVLQRIFYTRKQSKS